MKIHKTYELRGLIHDLMKKPDKIKALTIEQRADIVEYLKSEKHRATIQACELIEANPEYAYPPETTDKIDFWMRKSINFELTLLDLLVKQPDQNTPERNPDGVLKVGKYTDRFYCFTDILFHLSNSEKKPKHIDLESKQELEQYLTWRYGKNMYVAYRKEMANLGLENLKPENITHRLAVYINSLPRKYKATWKNIVLDISGGDLAVKRWLKSHSY